MRRNILLLAIPALMLCYTAYAEDPVQFIDHNLKIAVETALGVTDPTPGDMLLLYRLDAMSKGITDITGLEYATNLGTLDLRFNQIADVSPLSGLINLWWLGIYSNCISDLSPLSGLTNLQELDPGNNQISDISAISNMTNLTYLDLTQNQISNVNALSGLTNLRRLYLSQNQITDISPLSGLTNLTSLDIGWNQVTDINDLSALTALEGLWLPDNQIADVSILTGFTNLTTLWLQQNPLNDNAYCTDLATIAANNPSLTTLGYTPNSKPPTGISASDGTYSDKVSITWNQQYNGPNYTSFYKVYRADSATSAKSAISSWQSTTSFDDTSATAGVTYTYWVQAATSNQGEYTTDYSVSDTGYISNGQPPQQTCAITGKKWNDVNGDGSSSGEQGLSGWTIFAEPAATANEQLDANEVFAITDPNGDYTISSLVPGTYRVYEVLVGAWSQTFPSQGFHEVTCTDNQTITNIDFGNKQTELTQQFDWADAPDPPYPTLQASNGAYHIIVPGLSLGGSVDADVDGQPQPDALGDDHDGNDDEDGVIFLTPLLPGQQAAIEVITPAAGHLDAWIDFDADGNWTQTPDQIFQSEAVSAGSNLLTFHVPTEIAIDVDTYARFRFSSTGALAPDGPAQDGEVEDYHILLGEGGPMVPGESPPPEITWSQPPIEINPNIESAPLLCGWAEPARSTEHTGQKRQWRMDADDFRCINSAPVTRLRWWGGYKAWGHPEPPELQPQIWHIGFWANQIEDIPRNEAFPERIVWSLEIPPDRVHIEPVGLNEFPQQIPSMCFKYEVQLEPEEWFHQAEFYSNEDVFWISITAIYPADAEQVNMWGWFTRPHLWGNGAVMPAIMGDWPTYDERLFPGRIYPIENSVMCGQNQAYDLCFELQTEQPWIKWSQSFTDSRDWPGYNGQLSMAFEPEGGELSVLRQAADDWICEGQQPVNAVVWNGSYIGYEYRACTCEETIEPRRPDYFLLSIWTNTQPSDTGHAQHPGEKVWEYAAFEYDEVLVGYEGNFDGEPSDTIFRYLVKLPEDAWFRPQLPESIYWLSIMAVFNGPVNEIPYQWGWTNHPHIFGTTTLAVDNRSAEPSQWQQCLDINDEPVDMSFVLFAAP